MFHKNQISLFKKLFFMNQIPSLMLFVISFVENYMTALRFKRINDIFILFFNICPNQISVEEINK